MRDYRFTAGPTPAERKRQAEERRKAERARQKAEREAYKQAKRAREEASRARQYANYATRAAIEATDQAMALDIINAGYRALSRKHHPDLGGSHEQMVSLNRVCDRLRLIVGGCS
jgi:hypothetical protein